MTPMKGISLYQIEQGLADLIEYRQERLADREHPPDQDEINAIEGEIQKYQIAEPAKVAGVAAIFRKWKAQRANIAAEIERLELLDKMLDAMETRLKEKVAIALELAPIAPGTKSRKLTGYEGSVLMLKPNGGLEPLSIDGWDSVKNCWTRPDGESVLPLEFQIATISIEADQWAKIWDAYCNTVINTDKMAHASVKSIVPNNALIRKTLAEDCDMCGGMKAYQHPENPCPQCNATGKKKVPGARLEPRGSHVEIK